MGVTEAMEVIRAAAWAGFHKFLGIDKTKISVTLLGMYPVWASAVEGANKLRDFFSYGR